MSQLSDRLLILLIAATALGAVLWWAVGFIRAETAGTTRFVGMAVVGLLYVGVLALVWLEFIHIDKEAPGEPE